MLPQELVPTHLVRPSERPRVVIEPARPPSPWQTFFFYYQLLSLGLLALWLRLTGRFTPAHYARRVRAFLLNAGTVWIKLGQTIGMRSDLITVEFAGELASLRERGRGVPFDAIRATLERELRGPLERTFDEFSPAPFAASSSFQLHRAHLRREKVWVAVKVIHPTAVGACDRDLALLRRIAGWLESFRIYPKMRWGDLVREVEDLSRRELDLRYEESALRHLQQTLPAHGVYVPEVYGLYSTERVLVMEFIHAALLADFIEMKHTDPDRLGAWLEENDIDPRRVAYRLFHSVWRQTLEDNFFHADLHPENVILLRHSRLAVIDCRSVGQFEAESLAKHRLCIESLAEGEYATAAEYLFLLASRLPLVDLGEVKAQFVRLWRRWESRNHVRGLPPLEKSVSLMLDGLNRIMYQYNFESQWGLARFMQSLTNADRSTLQLAANVNYLSWLRRYFRAASRRRNRINVRELADRAVLNVVALLELPKVLTGDSIAQQEVLRRQARIFQSTTSKTGYFLATMYSLLASAVLLVGALLGCAFLSQHAGLQVEAVLGPQLGAVVRLVPALSLWGWGALLMVVLYLHRRMVVRRRIYLERDVLRQPEARPAI